MRTFNRLLGLAATAALAAASVVVVIEVVAAQLDRQPILVHWRHWPVTLQTVPWSSGDTRTVLAVAALASLVLLAIELWPRRDTDLLIAEGSCTTVLVRRRDLERSVAGAVDNDVHGASRVSVACRPRRLSVDVHTDRTDTTGLHAAATAAAQAAVERQRVQNVPPLVVRVHGVKP